MSQKATPKNLKQKKICLIHFWGFVKNGNYAMTFMHLKREKIEYFDEIQMSPPKMHLQSRMHHKTFHIFETFCKKKRQTNIQI